MTEIKPIDWVVQNTNLFTSADGEKLTPTYTQNRITNGEFDNTYLVKHRQSGATTAIISRLVYNLHNNKDKTYLYYATSYNSANRVYNQLYNVMQSSGARFTKLAVMSFELENGCKMCISCGNERDLHGFKFDEAFFDEIAPPENLVSNKLMYITSIDR